MNLLIETGVTSSQLAETLKQRAAELRAILHTAAGASADHSPDVLDFKDVAAEDARAAIDEVAYAHAAAELAQVMSALRRIEEGSYGLCEDCGEAIDERRLRALPATPYCTACQELRERPALQRG